MWKCNSCNITGELLPLDCPRPTLNQCNVVVSTRDSILVEREKTHGSFQMGSKVAQEIKESFRWGPSELRSQQREALDLIATKIGRIVCGQPMTKDHWDDIAGYAKLGAEACE